MNCINHSESFIVYTSTIDSISCQYNFYDRWYGADKIWGPLWKQQGYSTATQNMSSINCFLFVDFLYLS